MSHENLWAPWRMAYLRELNRKSQELTSGVGGAEVSAGDFLAQYFQRPDDDEKNLVVYRNADGIVLLNRYPYANGHLMIALGEARPTLLDYATEQRIAFWKLVDIAVELCHKTLRPQGLNIGINEGRPAGAGVPEHLHAHVVPRWNGDTNFMAAIGEVRVIPDALEAMAREYREAKIE